MDRPAENAVAQWTTPECPFTIEYPVELLDNIRLAVVDAFHSLQRGGVEIGGLLLGRFEKARLIIVDSVAFDCEHALGPSFTLSTRDLAALEKLVAQHSGSGPQPVGWYHSHTRSPIQLTQADQEIHRRFFPDPRQVALVLRPHAFEPVRAGFFFRESDGSIHANASYLEFSLEPRYVKPAPRADDASASPLPTRRRPLFQVGAVDLEPEPLRAEPEITIPVLQSPLPPPLPTPLAAAPPPAEESEAVPVATEQASAPAPVEAAPPNLLVAQPAKSRRWIAILFVILGLALGAGAFETRDRWLPRLQAWMERSPATSEPADQGPLPTSVGLTTIDSTGQLLIRWNQQAPAIRNGIGALLLITDEGVSPQAIGLDQPHLQTGSFTYVRQSGRVDVRLTIQQPGGRDVSEVATFLGQPPASTPFADDAGVQKERDDLLREAAKWKADMANQAARTKKLERTIEDLRLQLKRTQQRKRLEIQSPDSVRR